MWDYQWFVRRARSIGVRRPHRAEQGVTDRADNSRMKPVSSPGSFGVDRKPIVSAFSLEDRILFCPKNFQASISDERDLAHPQFACNCF